MDANVVLPAHLNLDDAVWAAFNDSLPEPAPLPTPNPTKSFWLDSDNSANPLARVGSTGPLPQSADIVIIGSGITGCSAAYHLSRLLETSGGQTKPITAVMLEARDFCSGATGRNGGHLTAATIHDFRERVKAHGVDDALRAVALEKHTVSSILDFLDQRPGTSKEVELVKGGHVSLLFTPSEIEGARADMAAAAEAGMDLAGVEWLEPEDMKQRFRVQLPGVYSPGNTIWPLKLVTKLFESAKGIDAPKSWIGSAISVISRGAPKSFSLDLFTHAPVNAVEPASSDALHRWEVKSSRGSIRARYIIHATNAYASHILPHLSGPTKGIVPTRSQCLAYRASRRARDWPTVGWRANEGYEYWFARPPKDEGEKALVILGGGREAVPNHGFNVADDSTISPTISRVLRQFLPHLYPNDFENHEPEMEWTGIMGFTRTRDPLVGQVYNDDDEPLTGQYIAAGYTGHGMPRAFACAEVVARMIHADMSSTQWSLPDWFPRHFLTKPAKD